MDLSQPVRVTRRMILVGGAIVGLALGVAIIAVVVIAIRVNDVQQEQITANAERIDALRRLQALERPPTQEELTAAALRALRAIRACARDPECRRRNPGVRDAARGISSGRLPASAPATQRDPAPSTSGASSTPRPRGPTVTSTPQPAQPAPRPSAPAGPPSRPTPSSPPAQAPATPPEPAAPAPPPRSVPTPQPPAPLPTPETPDVDRPRTPSLPPVTVPTVPSVPPVPSLPRTRGQGSSCERPYDLPGALREE